MVALAYLGNAQEMVWFSPLVIHSPQPCSFHSLLPGPSSDTFCHFLGTLGAIKRPVGLNLKLPSQIQFHGHLVPSCEQPGLVLRAAGGRRGGGTSCPLPPLPLSLLSLSGVEEGEEVEGQKGRCLFLNLTVTHPLPQDSRFVPLPPASSLSPACMAGSGGMGRRRAGILVTSALRRYLTPFTASWGDLTLLRLQLGVRDHSSGTAGNGPLLKTRPRDTQSSAGKARKQTAAHLALTQ